jgi:peptide-methionine (S)-S-oxide reductase
LGVTIRKIVFRLDFDFSNFVFNQILEYKMQKATFAAGCFWGVELAFQQVEGVVETSVGYTSGQTKDPTYEQVCTGRTGHAEAVEVVFDPEKVSYSELLNVFWKKHDPTTLNRQGPDIGTQYRSGIYYHDAEQKGLAEESKANLDASGSYRSSIVTEITEASVYYPAEDYHQKYLEKRGMRSCS